MIKNIKYQQEEFSYPVFDFLYPYLVRYAWKNELNFEGSTLILSEGTLSGLEYLLEVLIIELLQDFYVEPDHKKRSKYPSRYSNIEVGGNKYALDITSNPKDRIVYQIVSLLNWVKELPNKCKVTDR